MTMTSPECSVCGNGPPFDAHLIDPICVECIGTMRTADIEVQIRAVLSEYFGGGQWTDGRDHRFTPAAVKITALLRASADTRPEGGDATQIAAPFTSGAVAANSSETPNLSAEGDS